RGGLVAAGHRWLGERFGRAELLAVLMLLAGGVLTALSVVSVGTAAPLSDLDEVIAAVVLAAVAGVLARSSRGVMLGAGVGVLYVATGLFTKEIADRFVRDGLAAVPKLVITPGPWLMIALGVWAISMVQHAFARANAATVAAATTTISADGLILASVILYGQPLTRGGGVIPLVLGILLSSVGAVALAFAELRDRKAGRPNSEAQAAPKYED
ncbi:MAG: hypothetical protein ACP5H2_07750, partial [Solirubrobacteraceae bacterium]